MQIGACRADGVRVYSEARKVPRCEILTEIKLVVGVGTLEYIRYFTDGHKCGRVYGMYDGLETSYLESVYDKVENGFLLTGISTFCGNIGGTSAIGFVDGITYCIWLGGYYHKSL